MRRLVWLWRKFVFFRLGRMLRRRRARKVSSRGFGARDFARAAARQRKRGGKKAKKQIARF